MLYILSLSENYLTVKGAALILSPTQCRRRNVDNNQDDTDGLTVTSKFACVVIVIS